MKRRVTGALILGTCMLAWGGTDHWFIIGLVWMGFIVAAYLITGEVFAILFTVCMLATVRALLGAEPLQVYVWTAILSGTAALIILGSRFRHRIHATREARWKHRQQ